MAFAPEATPWPRSGGVYADPILPRQGLGGAISSILDGGGSGGGQDTTTNGNGGSTPNGGDSTGGGSTPVTTPTTTSPTTTSPTTTTPTTTTPTTTTQQPITTTSSARQTITSSATSNGLVVQTVITTEAPTVVTTMPTAAPETTRSSNSSNGGKIGGIVGGVVGGLALITLVAFVIILWRRRKARTGSGWFLCFGRKPDRKNELDVDWPTFEPTMGAAGVGGTFGASAAVGRRKSGNTTGNGGTLPDVDEATGDGYGAYSNYGASGYGGQHENMSSYAGAPASYASPTSDYQQQQQWGMTSFSNAQHSTPSNADTPSVPDYSHLDTPEVREERARQQAQAQAMAAAQAAATGGGSGYGGSSPPPGRYGSPVGTASPPLTGGGQQRGSLSADHRLSQGTAQMLSDNNYFMSNDDETGTAINNGDPHRTPLHLHNPDA